MIIDLPRFIAAERTTWTELEKTLNRLESTAYREMSLEEVQRFHLLYQKVSADLGRVTTFADEPDLKRYLESLTARAYGEIHGTRLQGTKFRPFHWFVNDFPLAFRRRWGAFLVVLAVSFVGFVFGVCATALDPDAKEAILPQQFSHLLDDPAKRVAEEEHAKVDRMEGEKSTFASQLMTNNIRVSIFTLGLGITFGIGTIINLFYNMVLLGLVAVDYILAGQSMFLFGWLMPHGVIEIPAILIAGQGGLVLGKALIGSGDRTPLEARLRQVGPDLMMLVYGFAVMLVWAGLVESFLSQYHEPVIRYWQKIAFGVFELSALVWFLGFKTVSEPEEETRSMISSLRIKTPEGITFSYLLAGPVVRCLAWIVDFAIIIASARVLIQLALVAGLISPDFAMAIATLGMFVLSIGYGLAMEWLWRGQTFGKRLMRLRVMDAQGLRLQFHQILLRNLLRFVDMLPLLYLVGGIACYCSRRAQRLGDLAANTIVVYNTKHVEPDLDQLMAGKFNSLRQYPHLEARLRQRVSAAEARLALQALVRRDELDPAARVDLFAELADHFKAAVTFPADAVESVPDEQYVRNVVDILFRARGPEKKLSAAQEVTGTGK